MRHRKRSQRLSRTLGHRRATLRNLVISLLRYQMIKTTKTKARLTQSLAERLISLGKRNTLQSRRLAREILNDKIAVNKLFSQIAPLFKNRACGFSRIIRYTHRHGDGAELVFLELTEKAPRVKPLKPKKEKAKLAPVEKVKESKPKEPVAESKPEEKPKLLQKKKPAKMIKPKKFLGGLRRLFKKERDSL